MAVAMASVGWISILSVKFNKCIASWDLLPNCSGICLPGHRLNIVLCAFLCQRDKSQCKRGIIMAKFLKFSFIISFLFLFCFIPACTSGHSTSTTTTTTVVLGTGDDPAQYGVPFSGVPDIQDASIYQVNMRCFSSSRNFKGVSARLDQVQALGVNVIYLMPIYPVGDSQGVQLTVLCEGLYICRL